MRQWRRMDELAQELVAERFRRMDLASFLLPLTTSLRETLQSSEDEGRAANSPLGPEVQLMSAQGSSVTSYEPSASSRILQIR